MAVLCPHCEHPAAPDAVGAGVCACCGARLDEMPSIALSQLTTLDDCGADVRSTTGLEERFPCDEVGMAPENVTSMLRAWGERGDRAAFDKIVPLIRDDLRRLAIRLLRGERPGYTFAPTDLIHEAYLRLANGVQLELKDRAHFFAIASRCMRQILVDRARRRRAGKRGAGERPITLDEDRIAIERPWDLVALDDALDELAKFNERKARVTELHYFGGMTHQEIAEVCDIHVNTVARDLHFSEAWLRSRLTKG